MKSKKKRKKRSRFPAVLRLLLVLIVFGGIIFGAWKMKDLLIQPPTTAIVESSTLGTVAPSFFGFVLCGLLWGLSLIVPGLSSSTILIFIGLFEPLTAGIGSLDIKVLVPFVLGIGTTALLFARLVTMLFQKHYAVFSRVILGFVIASSLKILPSSYESLPMLIVGLVCFAGGFVVAMLMDGASEKERQ